MAKSPSYQRVPWEDRFNRPELKQLRAALPARARSIFDRTRKSILELEGVQETAAWYGDSWKWTVEFRTKGCEEPLAVIVPSPEDLQLAVHLDLEFINSLSPKRMKRAVRDGLELAQEPFDTRWGIWSLQAMNLLDDLMELIESKLRHTGMAAG